MNLDREHIIHYFIISGILTLGVSLTLFFSAEKQLQMFVVIGFSLLYLIYGIFHHYSEHDLTVKIVVEYVLVALLAIVLFFFVLEGS